MKFSALKEDLLSAVQTVQYSSDLRGMMPILSGVKIESTKNGLDFHSTNLESYTRTFCAANVVEEGVCVVSLKILMDFLKDSSDEKIEAEIVGNEMVVVGKNAIFKFFTMPPEDFPNAPIIDIPVLEEIESDIFLPAVNKVAKASSRDEKRPTLTGILLEIEDDELRMVSTDSYRLAIKKTKEGYKAAEKGQYIIPSTAMANLSRIVGKTGKLTMYRDENKGQIKVSAKNVSQSIRLIEGKFPKYDQFIPEKLEKTVETGKEDLLRAIKRNSLISSTIKMSIENSCITLLSDSREVGEGKEKIEALCEGEGMEIVFNGKFLEEGINCIDGERVVFGLSEPLKPGIIRDRESEDFMYIIMPIRQ